MEGKQMTLWRTETLETQGGKCRVVLNERHFSVVIVTMMLLLYKCKQHVYRNLKH